ncbi:uncharacterized protein [Phyllobates terribilis]|uniref:uncharacterized protein n=1 Tax=Phyllobates terribilis TaxID=111132 RepID=UPI003CCB0EFA
MTTKRAYKLQEFVAHASTVNCLKIGKKSSRVLVTGGEDHKVNLWAIGKPNAIVSLSGHSSGIDSVSFDSSEVLVAAGAASGTIKLWDLEEAKIVRTLTGHRSNCISVDFHPFGEFFASGSLDTNLKIWDIRKKGCIHTYKGHTRGVSAIRFTPDGRWIVSGGEDNTVKLWDLTAGKLMHDFKCHEGQVQCIDFHPHEFLMATGSADKTVKFWDLETFELIGSSGPETSGVRCLAFNPDGRTMLCGLHESLKVVSWEPIQCHDTVDVGWSKLSDLNVHEGKLLGCSYNQSCVGVWVVDISRTEPYAVQTGSKVSTETKSATGRNSSVLTENNVKVVGRLSVSQNSDLSEKETKPAGRVSSPTNSLPVNKDSRTISSTGGVPGTPHRNSISTSPKKFPASTAISTAVSMRRNAGRSQIASNNGVTTYSKSDIVPVVVPRNDPRLEEASEARKEIFGRRTIPISSVSKSSSFRRPSSASDESEGESVAVKPLEGGGVANRNIMRSVRNLSISPDDRSLGLKNENRSSSEPNSGPRHGNYEFRMHKTSKDTSSYGVQRTGADVKCCVTSHLGRIRSFVANSEGRERNPGHEGPATVTRDEPIPSSNMLRCWFLLLSYTLTSSTDNILSKTNKSRRGYPPSPEKEICSVSDDDAVADILEKHGQFMSVIQNRLSKLQILRRYWERNDIKATIGAMEKMGDHGVLADVVSLLAEKVDVISLEVCTALFPLLSGLLESDMDRHLEVSLELLVKLVRVFGPVIYPAVSATTPSVGVDIELEQRLERCNLCFIELEKVKRCLPSFTRRGGAVAKLAQELNLSMTSAF